MLERLDLLLEVVLLPVQAESAQNSHQLAVLQLLRLQQAVFNKLLDHPLILDKSLRVSAF